MLNSTHELISDYGLDALAAVLHENARDRGFWDYPTDINFILSKLALIHSEVSELLEAVRKDRGEQEITYEIADIIIRTLDLYAALRNSGHVSMSLDLALHEKTEFNKGRPHKHGVLA